MTWVPLKRVADVWPSNVDKLTVEGEYPVRLVNYTDVYYGDRLHPGLPLMNATATSDEIAKFRLRPGDVILTKDSETADDIGISAHVDDATPDMVCGYHLSLVRPRSAVGRYLHYAISSTHARRQMSVAATGVTRFGLRAESIGSLSVWLPTEAEQLTIADYLDDETARIDALIAKKQRLIHLLEERLFSAIAAAQDSWGFVPLKHLVRWREGPGIMAADFRDEGVPLIRLAGVGGEEVTLRGCNYLDPALVAQRWSHFRLLKGDYLISASASMGVVSCVGSEAEGAVPYTGLIIFRPLGDTDMEFMRWFLQGPAFMHQIDLLKTGTAIQHFGPIHLEAIGCPSPPPPEQRRIGQQLAALRSEIAAGTEALSRQIDLLAEHRQALITAAVTDEFVVPGAA